jgi:transposase
VIDYPVKKNLIKGGARMNYMGIDHHKQYSHFTLLNEAGVELKSERVFNNVADVESFLGSKRGEIKAVIEAGRTSYVMVDMLRDLGVDIRMAHASEVKAIAKAKIKTDKRDAKILADLLRADLIPEVYLRSQENRQAQRVLRHRAFYVETRTRVKNKIRVLLAQQSPAIEKEVSQVKGFFSRKGLEVLRRLRLPDLDKELTENLLDFYGHLDERIGQSDALVKKLYTQLSAAQRIDTIPGFGVFLSVLTAVEIADIKRFASAAKLHCYSGVVPSTHSSGERCFHGKIIKSGNLWLRWAAVEAVYPAIKKDFDLKVFYERLARRKAANVAKVATAKRLLAIVYRMLRDERDYIPYKR